LSYKVYELIGWYKYLGRESFLRVESDVPDRLWYGNKPQLLFELKGVKAEPVVDQIEKMAQKYPYKNTYKMLGPNSNTFTAWMICQISELSLNLSWRAIGKNWKESSFSCS